MNKNFLKSLIMLYIVVSLTVSGILFSSIIRTQREINDSKEELGEVFEEYLEHRNQLEMINKELYMEVLDETFSASQLLQLKERYTSYALQVNGKVITGNKSVIELNSNSAVITFFEKFDIGIGNVFPDKILYDISLFSDNNYKDMKKINDLIFIYTNQATYEEKSEILLSGDGIMKHYYFENLQPGEIITLDIHHELSQKIGLDDGTIEIFYSKTN